jgi:6-phosphogluconolactonase
LSIHQKRARPDQGLCRASLIYLNEQSTNGDVPVHISISPNGHAAFATNYGSGSLTPYAVERSGQLSAPTSHFEYTPVDEQTEHQHAHAHEATPSHDGRWLLVNDLGSDRVYTYRINPATGSLNPGTTTYRQGRFKSGPRHLVFHPNGHWVYNANELDSTVDHLRWNNRECTLTRQGTFVSTLPPAFPIGNRP